MSDAESPILTGTSLGPDRRVSGRIAVVDALERTAHLEADSVAYVPDADVATNNVVLFYELVRAGVNAILCENLGRTDHGVLLANELGVPCLSDVDRTAAALEGAPVTVVGDAVYHRDEREAGSTERTLGSTARAPSIDVGSLPETSTDVTLALGFPEVLERRPELARASDGVGFMRLEFVLLDVLQNLHPRTYVERHGRDRLERAVADRIELVLQAYGDDSPVWIRTDDFAVEHLRQLEGGREFEPREENPMLGWRGIARSIESPLLYDVQLGAIGRLLERGYDSIGLFPPMTRFYREYEAWQDRAVEAGCGDVTFGVMVETPAAALTFEAFVDDVEFVVFGSNDLTQFTLAIDRTNDRLRPAYDESEDAVLALFERVISIAAEHGIETSIGGQAASDPDLAGHLLEYGIDQLAVAPTLETVLETRAVLETLEGRSIDVDGREPGRDGWEVTSVGQEPDRSDAGERGPSFGES